MPASAKRIKGEVNNMIDETRTSEPKEILAKECKFCGKYFKPTKPRQRYCSDICRSAAKKVKSKMTKEDEVFLKKKESNLKHKSQEDLARDAFNAREAGLTYGQYMARKYAPRINPH